MENNEILIRKIISEWVNAFYEKDAEMVMNIHVDDLVSFDIVPPLRYIGKRDYKKQWDDTFVAFKGPIIQEIIDLNVVAGDDVAFSYCLNRMKGTTNEGEQMDFYYRWTACYKKIDGKWLIAHDHTSAPTDFSNGTAVLNLKPEDKA